MLFAKNRDGRDGKKIPSLHLGETKPVGSVLTRSAVSTKKTLNTFGIRRFFAIRNFKRRQKNTVSTLGRNKVGRLSSHKAGGLYKKKR